MREPSRNAGCILTLVVAALLTIVLLPAIGSVAWTRPPSGGSAGSLLHSDLVGEYPAASATCRLLQYMDRWRYVQLGALRLAIDDASANTTHIVLELSCGAVVVAFPAGGGDILDACTADVEAPFVWRVDVASSGCGEGPVGRRRRLQMPALGAAFGGWPRPRKEIETRFVIAPEIGSEIGPTIGPGAGMTPEMGPKIGLGTGIGSAIGATIRPGAGMAPEIGAKTRLGTRMAPEIGATIRSGAGMTPDMGPKIGLGTGMAHEMGAGIGPEAGKVPAIGTSIGPKSETGAGGRRLLARAEEVLLLYLSLIHI
jgi:hypothetical protein